MQEILYSITPQDVLMVVFVGTATLIGLMAGMYLIDRKKHRGVVVQVRHEEVSIRPQTSFQEEVQVAPLREVASEMQDMSPLPVQETPKRKAPQRRIKKIIVR